MTTATPDITQPKPATSPGNQRRAMIHAYTPKMQLLYSLPVVERIKTDHSLTVISEYVDVDEACTISHARYVDQEGHAWPITKLKEPITPYTGCTFNIRVIITWTDQDDIRPL